MKLFNRSSIRHYAIIFKIKCIKKYLKAFSYYIKYGKIYEKFYLDSSCIFIICWL